jgi:hypothetical protein
MCIVCMYVCVYVCMYVCMYVYANKMVTHGCLNVITVSNAILG